ncbi:MAG TPA: deoxyribose-phosphate aldolase [Clostridiaceae bacterium]|nr:deoxyribose-phosphate aldolase [Clostridiaceae bacterium]
MENKDILTRIDHTALSATTTTADIAELCREATIHGCAAVCIPPAYVATGRELLSDLASPVALCTVIGFPLGYQTSTVKMIELTQAIGDGADELDVVINLGMVKNNNWEDLENELTALRTASAGKILKVIVETCYLTEGEKIRLCQLVTRVKADYIKTSTGFGEAGAALEDIALFREHIGQHVKIKAAGGIRTRDEMIAFIEAGCDRIGSSRGVSVLTESNTEVATQAEMR